MDETKLNMAKLNLANQ